MNARSLPKVVRAFTTAQRLVNTRVDSDLLQAAERHFKRKSSCADCREPTKHCCRMLVVTSLLDAVPIAARVLAAGDTDLVKRLHEAAECQQGLTATEYWRKQEPCAFLRDERCTIYDVRPLPCRSHYAWSPTRHCAIDGESASLITTEPGLEADAAALGYLQAVLRTLFEHAPKLPYVDLLPTIVLYALDALQSKTEHRLIRKLIEAQTDLALLERRAQDVLCNRRIR